MQYSIYKLSNGWKKIAVKNGDVELFRYLAAYQAELKGTKIDFETGREYKTFNNKILDSIYLNSGNGEYAILNEFDNYVDPRPYYPNILKYRDEYVYFPWGGVKMKSERKKSSYIFRRGPVPNSHCHYGHPRYWKGYGYKHLLREVTHEDFREYNRDTRRIDILTMGGRYYSDRQTKSSYGDKCWKRQKIKKQYMKHQRYCQEHPMFDKENMHTARKLMEGQTCLVQGFGNSMTPILKSGQVCEVKPVTDHATLKKGDIVLCKVNGHVYLHMISAIRDKQFQISNNHKHINGWVGANNIFGVVTKILQP